MSNSSMKIRDLSPPPWPDVDSRSWNFNPATKSPIDDEKMEETLQKEVEEKGRRPAKMRRRREGKNTLENMIKIENMEYKQDKESEDSEAKISPIKERQDYWSYEKNIISTKLKPDLIVNKTKLVMGRINTTKNMPNYESLSLEEFG